MSEEQTLYERRIAQIEAENRLLRSVVSKVAIAGTLYTARAHAVQVLAEINDDARPKDELGEAKQKRTNFVSP